ncbi:MAG: hypothetical protein KGL56_02905 [Alphaproteobacteria bacterium]|nr:hypothetical protein [Alphaproteobacteria bacterium]
MVVTIPKSTNAADSATFATQQPQRHTAAEPTSGAFSVEIMEKNGGGRAAIDQMLSLFYALYLVILAKAVQLKIVASQKTARNDDGVFPALAEMGERVVAVELAPYLAVSEAHHKIALRVDPVARDGRGNAALICRLVIVPRRRKNALDVKTEPRTVVFPYDRLIRLPHGRGCGRHCLEPRHQLIEAEVPGLSARHVGAFAKRLKHVVTGTGVRERRREKQSGDGAKHTRLHLCRAHFQIRFCDTAEMIV